MNKLPTNDISTEVWEKDRRHFLHPWTHFDSFKEEGSLVVNEADGVYVFDIQGNRYLDGVGGLWCVNIGYGREEMVEAIAGQARKLAYANPFGDVTNTPAALLTARLSELAPGSLNRVMLSCGGSTANDSAYRLIQYYHGCRGENDRKIVLSRRSSYHGSTYIAQTISGKSADRQKEFGYAENLVAYVSEPNLYRMPDGVTDETFADFLIDEFAATVRDVGPENIAAHFAEPIMGAGGVVVPPQRYIEETRNVCAEHGIVYVADEVVTAFGRLGCWFASKDVFNIQPDVIVCAKGLTSGYQPLGATIFSDEIYDTIAEDGRDRVFSNGFTYSGHPVACAAALKNIEIIEREGILDHVRDDVGPYFMERLNTLRDLPSVGDIRGMHLMACVVSMADKETKELFPAEVDIGKLISVAAEKRGLLVRPVENLNILSPPLTITRPQIDDLVAMLRDAIVEVQDNLTREKRWAS